MSVPFVPLASSSLSLLEARCIRDTNLFFVIRIANIFPLRCLSSWCVFSTSDVFYFHTLFIGLSLVSGAPRRRDALLCRVPALSGHAVLGHLYGLAVTLTLMHLESTLALGVKNGSSCIFLK